MTSQDWTTYFETFPAERIDLALQVESDRMANSVFDADEVESERTVILSEREGTENSYFYLLSEEVQAAAFRVHSYHHPIIGWQRRPAHASRATISTATIAPTTRPTTPSPWWSAISTRSTCSPQLEALLWLAARRPAIARRAPARAASSAPSGASACAAATRPPITSRPFTRPPPTTPTSSR